MSEVEDFDLWISRSVCRADIAAAAPLRRLAALLDRPAEDDGLVPPLGHWLYFLPEAAQAELGSDGHPKRGGELPDFGLERRMWAGSRVDFLRPIPIGTAIERRTAIKSVARKQGSTGPLAFVTLAHEIQVSGETALIEEQDLVFRGPAAPASPTRPPEPKEAAVFAAEGMISRSVAFDPVALFRFSALTFNAHRIHYDRDYACGVEGYPGLVVHGPFQAMLLMDLFRRSFPERLVRRFSFRAQSPLFEGEPAALVLEPTEEGGRLSLRSAGGRISVVASVVA